MTFGKSMTHGSIFHKFWNKTRYKSNCVCHKLKFVNPYGVNLWYFKLRLFDLTELIVWHILCLRHWVATILGIRKSDYVANTQFESFKVWSCMLQYFFQWHLVTVKFSKTRITERRVVFQVFSSSWSYDVFSRSFKNKVNLC